MSKQPSELVEVLTRYVPEVRLFELRMYPKRGLSDAERELAEKSVVELGELIKRSLLPVVTQPTYNW